MIDGWADRPHRYIRAVERLPDRLDGCDHRPGPAWMCTACTDVPWPCAPARCRLGEAYGRDRVGLAMYLGTLLEVAAADLRGSVGAGELYERFVAWTR